MWSPIASPVSSLISRGVWSAAEVREIHWRESLGTFLPWRASHHDKLWDSGERDNEKDAQSQEEVQAELSSEASAYIRRPRCCWLLGPEVVLRASALGELSRLRGEVCKPVIWLMKSMEHFWSWLASRRKPKQASRLLLGISNSCGTALFRWLNAHIPVSGLGLSWELYHHRVV